MLTDAEVAKMAADAQATVARTHGPRQWRALAGGMLKLIAERAALKVAAETPRVVLVPTPPAPPAPIDFAALLRGYREHEGLSCNELARAVGVDPSYISRLERGEREPPRRRVVLELTEALHLALDAQDRLLVSAGYAPATVAQLGHWDPALEAVADVLVDARLQEADRDAFRQVIRLVAERWRGGARAGGTRHEAG